jgi:hypothetical protein
MRIQSVRGTTSLTLATLLLAGSAIGAPVAAANQLAKTSNRASASAAAAVKPACQDRAFSFIGGRWAHAVHWTFDSATTPAGMTVAAAEAALVKSFNNITTANNDCGKPDKVDAKNVYDGRAARAPNINRNAMCAGSDGKNEVGFGRLPAGILAVTCTRIFGGFIVEADIRINTRFDWAATVADCSNEELIEPTITHEVGHVFGLGHVGEKRHPLMTMSTQSDGPCNDAASTLGLGDILGLQALY